MSFILDALKKSENERQKQSGPALFEVKVAPPPRRFPVWAVVVGALLGVNLIVLIAVLLLRDRSDPAVQATQAQIATAAATAAAAPATPSAAPSAPPGAYAPLSASAAAPSPGVAPGATQGAVIEHELARQIIEARGGDAFFDFRHEHVEALGRELARGGHPGECDLRVVNLDLALAFVSLGLGVGHLVLR